MYNDGIREFYGQKPAQRKSKQSTRNSALTVRVKSANEVVGVVQKFLAHNLHGRYNFSFSKKTQKQLVAYGPWLSSLLVVAILPELLALARYLQSSGSIATTKSDDNHGP